MVEGRYPSVALTQACSVVYPAKEELGLSCTWPSVNSDAKHRQVEYLSEN